jgi:hypothetical protein
MPWLSLGSIGSPCCCGAGCAVDVCVVDCSGNSISGASVSISAPGGPYTGTTVLGCTGYISIGTAGTYTTTVSKAGGYQTYTGSITYTCGGTTTVTLLATGATPCQITVYGCNGCLLTGATVTVDGETYTTTAGVASFTLPGPGSYPYTVNATRFATYSGTFTVTSVCSGCSTTVTLTPATGYVCATVLSCNCGLSAYPWPTTLFLTDTAWGSCTLTYNPTDQFWEGTISISWTGDCGCAADAWDGIFYQLGCNGIGIVPIITDGGAQPPQCVNVAATNVPTDCYIQSQSLTAIPVDLTATIVACDCGQSQFGEYQCEDGGVPNAAANVIYPAGATITVIE